MPEHRRTGRSRELVNRATGEVHELWEPEDEKRRSYQFGGRHGQFSFARILDMLAKDSGITGDDFRVFWYCAIMTYNKGGATASEAAKYLGLTPQAARRMAKKLCENRIFLVEEVIGRTKKYKASPHIVSSLSGAEQASLAAAYHLPTMPGRSGAASKGRENATPKPVSGARRSAGADRRAVPPQAELADDVRDSGRSGARRRAHGG
ncbi:helix-turn-helix domain-containing protein [Streptomyces sp. NRRL S-1868]|uniref:helix-turn-helix domain-containing protein n=1 Tax=Streptomyces sp. NRRL S-1868 TaxID=1463892 RepID=UPI001F46F9DA|nr:helix-turn-helix domain-containing protein [Streptomyces sp. NRRL S-1868]